MISAPNQQHVSPPLPQGQATRNNNVPSSCIRHGCTNAAVANAEWEDEYCSNECVVSHCR